MRILFISATYPSPRFPQRGTFNRSMIEGLRQHHDVRVIAPIPWLEWRPTCTATAESNQSHPCYFYPPKLVRHRYGTFLWRSIHGSIDKLTRGWQPDVVIGYWAHPDGDVAVRAAEIFRIPSVVMVGGTDVKLRVHDARRRRCIQQTLQRATKVVTFGQDLVTAVSGLGIAASKVSCIPRGVDPSVFFPEDRGLACAKLGVDAGSLRLLWVGRFVSVKRPERVLRIASALRDQVGDRLQVKMIGDGPLRKGLQRAVRRLGLDSLVSLQSSTNQRDLADWYRAASVTMLTSDSEGIPNVLRESQACGTPFVATDVGGVRQLVRSGIDELIPIENLERFPNAILRAESNRGIARQGEHLAQVRTVHEMVIELNDLLRSLSVQAHHQRRAPSGSAGNAARVIRRGTDAPRAAEEVLP